MTQPHQILKNRYQDDSEKRKYITSLFDRGAPYYDKIGRIGFLGSGHGYRKRALRKCGLKPGIKVLDVACGTGATTRAIHELLKGTGSVTGIDPSEGMLTVARKQLPCDFLLGEAEKLPFEDASFHFLCMGYALRHVSDISEALSEFRRVLKPGGRILIMEISKPTSRIINLLTRLYFRDILPRLSRLITGSTDAKEMMYYYWETIDVCVPPETILKELEKTGFKQANRRIALGVFSEYRAFK